MEQDVEQLVDEYRKRMHDWELYCKEKDAECSQGIADYAQVKADAMRAYSKIFQQFCASSATPRTFSYSDPPEYEMSPPITGVERGSSMSLVRVACHLFPDQHHEFKLIQENGSWKILERTIVTDRGTRLAADL